MPMGVQLMYAWQHESQSFSNRAATTLPGSSLNASASAWAFSEVRL